MAEFSCRPRQVDGDGSAKRRRLRRLRSWWRHEQQTVAAVLATVTHHSFGKVGTASGVLRNMETTTRTGNGEEYEAHYTAKFRKTPPQGGRPAPLPEVAGWQGRLERHVMEDLGSICPSVQILAVPVLQVVEQPEEVDSFFRNFVPAVAEQVIEVPKLALLVCAVQRAALPEPQLVEQLVEVPTVLSYSLLQQRTAEQTIDSAVPRRGGGARGGLQGFSQGQDSTAVCGAASLVISAPHGRGGGARGGLQGLSQGQGSTAVCRAENVVSPVPHGRGGLGGGGLHGLSQGQGSAAVSGAGHVDIPVPHGRVGNRGLHGSPRGQSSTASAVEQTIAVDRLQGFTRGQSSTSRRGGALPLPSGWRRAETAYGRVYYWHVHTRQTEFTPPASDDEDEDEEDEEEEDEDLDELDDTQSRFPAGFRPMRMCRWFPSGNCRQGWGCMFAHSVSELHPLAHGQGP